MALAFWILEMSAHMQATIARRPVDTVDLLPIPPADLRSEFASPIIGKGESILRFLPQLIALLLAPSRCLNV